LAFLRAVRETYKLINYNLSIVHTVHYARIYFYFTRPTVNESSVGSKARRCAVLLLQQFGHILVDVCNVEFQHFTNFNRNDGSEGL